jgi:hypothetical protein
LGSRPGSRRSSLRPEPRSGPRRPRVNPGASSPRYLGLGETGIKGPRRRIGANPWDRPMGSIRRHVHTWIKLQVDGGAETQGRSLSGRGPMSPCLLVDESTCRRVSLTTSRGAPGRSVGPGAPVQRVRSAGTLGVIWTSASMLVARRSHAARGSETRGPSHAFSSIAFPACA